MNTSPDTITITTKDCRLTVQLGRTKDGQTTVPFMLNNDPDDIKEKAEEAFYADIGYALYMQSEPDLKENGKTEVVFSEDGTVYIIGILTAKEWEEILKEYNDGSTEAYELEHARRWLPENWDPDGLFYKYSGINEAIDLLAELMGWE